MDTKYTILPSEYELQDTTSALKKAAVIVHLYYDDKLEHSFSYIRNIPGGIDTYIVTANPLLEQMVKDMISAEGMTNVTILRKPNRGRDFAALLVTSKDIIEKYEYICFVHDKKSHKGDKVRLGELWEECLFKCTLASGPYIKNIIGKFESDATLGFLSVPFPPTEYLLGLEGALWTINYRLTAVFLKELGLKRIPPITESPLYVGSAFWFRKDAVRKLLDLDLKYEDFPEEPMSIDGTLAHVIERSFGFVTEDAGYTSSFVTPLDYSEYILSKKTVQLSKAVDVLRLNEMLYFTDNKLDLDASYKNSDRMKQVPALMQYCRKFQRIFVFTDESVRKWRNELIDELEKDRIVVAGIFKDYPADDAIIKKTNNGFVICASKKNVETFVRILSEHGREGYII